MQPFFHWLFNNVRSLCDIHSCPCLHWSTPHLHASTVLKLLHFSFDLCLLCSIFASTINTAIQLLWFSWVKTLCETFHVLCPVDPSQLAIDVDRQYLCVEWWFLEYLRHRRLVSVSQALRHWSCMLCVDIWFCEWLILICQIFLAQLAFIHSKLLPTIRSLSVCQSLFGQEPC